MEILSSQWTLLSFIFFVFIAIILIRIRMQQSEKEREYTSQTNQHNVAPKSDGQSKEFNDKSQTNNKKLFILLFFGVAFLVAFLVGFSVNKDNNSEGGQNVALIPIWTAIFVPLLAAKKKTKEEMTNKDKEFRKLIILFILGFFMAFGIILLYFVNQN